MATTKDEKTVNISPVESDQARPPSSEKYDEKTGGVHEIGLARIDSEAAPVIEG